MGALAIFSVIKDIFSSSHIKMTMILISIFAVLILIVVALHSYRNHVLAEQNLKIAVTANKNLLDTINKENKAAQATVAIIANESAKTEKNTEQFNSIVGSKDAKIAKIRASYAHRRMLIKKYTNGKLSTTVSSIVPNSNISEQDAISQVQIDTIWSAYNLATKS